MTFQRCRYPIGAEKRDSASLTHVKKCVLDCDSKGKRFITGIHQEGGSYTQRVSMASVDQSIAEKEGRANWMYANSQKSGVQRNLHSPNR